jgi:intein/homing endonuclease
MKGTLFSADFVKDSNDDLRLLEVNTDTTSPYSNLHFFDYTNFINVLDSNDITKVTFIYKPNIQLDFVNHISESLNVSASFITTITRVEEGGNVIYPTSVNDADDTFIVRLAYDESAIFDSEYTKGTLNLLKLYSDNEESDMVCEFFHSSSVNGEYNTISSASLNLTNLPDLACKSNIVNQSQIEFYKIGSETENETTEDRWNNFLQTSADENLVFQKYHVSSETLDENKVSSIRVFSIVYGSNLDLIELASYKTFATFELPTEITYDETLYSNLIDSKHYYEFATNYIKYGVTFDGILDRHLLIKSDDTEVEAGDIQVGDSLKSYYIEGVSLNETEADYLNWNINGSSFPTGSYLTSSVVVYKNTKQLDNKALTNLEINNNEDGLFVANNKAFLVYDSINDKIFWKVAFDINADTDYLLDYDGSTAQVTKNEFFITSEDNLTLVEIDVEDTDTYIIAGTTPINSFVTHNAPCFVAGTKITLEDGSVKNIEDVKQGDIVSTFDLISNEIKYNKVNAVYSKEVNQIVEYKFDNGETLKCTIDHPIYIDGKGWSSYDETVSNKMYSLEQKVSTIQIGDVVKLHNGTASIIEMNLIDENTIVYNLQDIEGNHNFFANNVLVHNRYCFIAGTKITLENGDIKNIEDIEVGDIVLTYNEVSNLNEYNKVTDVYKPIHDDLVEYTLLDGKVITSTFDHPYYVNGLDLASYSPDLTNARYENLNNVVQIKIGDTLNLQNGEITSITSIVEKDKVSVQTYIFTVENNHNFYANEVLVHNKGGGGGSCFIAGTNVTMEDGSTKNIENVVEGDIVISYNEATLQNEPKKVIGLKTPIHNDIVKYEFANQTSVVCTFDHPFYVDGLELASYTPFLTNKRYELNKQVKQIKVGDMVYLSNGVSKTAIKDIIELDEKDTQTYIITVEDNHNFYANGILVHNK